MPKNNPFGLLAFLHWNHDWNHFHFPDEILEKAVRQIHELGVGFVRFDFSWSDINRGHMKYDFSQFEKIVALLKERKIQILGILDYNKEHNPEFGHHWNHPPDSFDEFAAYVNATVDHFKQDVHHWEIWNEPNLSIYWEGPKDSLRLYSSLLKMSYKAAKEADPTCVVLNGGLTEPILHDVENLYRNGGKDFTDIINIHTFVDPASPTAQERFDKIIHGVQSLMKKYSDENKKIWITEMGCPGVPTKKAPLTWFGGLNISEEEQADWLSKQFGFMTNHPIIEKMFWAFYRDTLMEFNDATDYFGLVKLDLSPKPAFERMKQIIKDFKS